MNAYKQLYHNLGADLLPYKFLFKRAIVPALCPGNKSSGNDLGNLTYVSSSAFGDATDRAQLLLVLGFGADRSGAGRGGQARYKTQKGRYSGLGTTMGHWHW